MAEAPRHRLEVDLRPLFPTPVAVARLHGWKEVNAVLKPVILEHERSHPSTQHSNLGGWQSTWDLLDWGGPAAGAVIEAAKALATKLTCDREGKAVRMGWRVNAWANVNRGGHGNEFHTHPGAYWSGTYYVDDGGIGADPSLGGEFEIQDPRGVAPAMYAPRLAFAVPGGLAAGASELIRPQSGLIVLFPSWLSHAVRPYTGERTRISIAYNFSL